MNTYLARLFTSQPILFNICDTIKSVPKDIFKMCTNFQANCTDVVQLDTDLKSFEYLIEILIHKIISKYLNQDTPDEYIELYYDINMIKLSIFQTKQLIDLCVKFGALEILHDLIYYLLNNYNIEIEKYLLDRPCFYPIITSCMFNMKKPHINIIKHFKKSKLESKVALQAILLNRTHTSLYQDIKIDPVMIEYMNIIKKKFENNKSRIVTKVNDKKYYVDVKSEIVYRKDIMIPLRLFLESYWFDILE